MHYAQLRAKRTSRHISTLLQTCIQDNYIQNSNRCNKSALRADIM